MNFFDNNNKNNYNFNQTNNPKKRYISTCPIFTSMCSCCSCDNCNCNLCKICSCSSCSYNTINIGEFRKNRPFCFWSIIAGIVLFIIILIIIIAVSVKKKKANEDSKDYIKILNNIGNNDKGSLNDFCNYLSNKASDLSEEQKVKLAYRWIVENIIYDKDNDVERDPDEFFKSRTTVCSGFARLFRRLLEAMNYNKDNIKNIYGYSKGAGYSVFTKPAQIDHEWNAVKINGKWCLFDATWDEGAKDEEYQYFCPKPECFVRSHLPQEGKEDEQFLSKPIDLDTWHKLAFTTGGFCEFNAQIIADQSIYNSCQGKFTVKYNVDFDTKLHINPEKNIEVTQSTINNGFEVSYKTSVHGQYELNLFLLNENVNYTSIANIVVKCG